MICTIQRIHAVASKDSKTSAIVRSQGCVVALLFLVQQHNCS